MSTRDRRSNPSKDGILTADILDRKGRKTLSYHHSLIFIHALKQAKLSKY